MIAAEKAVSSSVLCNNVWHADIECSWCVPGTTSSSTISDELRRAAFHINPKDIVIEQGEHGPVLLGKGAFGEARPCFSPWL